MASVTDLWLCGQCGSRRLRGTPSDGYLCLDCGRHNRCDFEVNEADGNAPDHQDGFWSSFDPRFDGVDQGDFTSADASTFEDFFPEDSSPEPGSRSQEPPSRPEPSVSLFSDAHSHLRCACCFELAGRCRRLVSLRGPQRCCVGCRCVRSSEA